MFLHPQVDSQQQIPAGSEMEVELRACTIAAVGMLRHALDARLQAAHPAAGDSESTAATSLRHSTAGVIGTAGGSSPATSAQDSAAVAESVVGEDSLHSCHGASDQSSQGVTAVAVDWWLWGKGEAQRDTAPPHHRTLTIYY